MKLIVRVHQIKGRCPVYQKGDEIIIRDGYVLEADKDQKICMHSLASLMPYYVALSRGVAAKDLGLTRCENGKAFVQCLDPCEFTGGGTVIFEIGTYDA
ncbi:TIGR04076 family protein [candidate division KSB1 bacterium]|nr:TIGR04076 family protein [candidate division KSB1 bacterium]